MFQYWLQRQSLTAGIGDSYFPWHRLAVKLDCASIHIERWWKECAQSYHVYNGAKVAVSNGVT